MLETIFIFLGAALGVSLAVFRPVAKETGISESWELAAGALSVIALCFHLSTTFLMPTIIEQDLAKQPCGEESPQGACYSLERSLCDTAWQTAEKACKAELAGVRAERPTALVGPSLNRCKARKMDHTLHFNRRAESTAYCRAYFDYIAGH